MIKVCQHGGWRGVCDNCKDKNPDGSRIVCLTPTETVVCHHTKFRSQCTNTGNYCHIDGAYCVVKDRNQELVALPGAENLQYRHDDMHHFRLKNDAFELDFKKAALIIMDMWDHHPSAGLALRGHQLAKPINDFAKFLRDKGTLIIHSPSERGVYAANNSSITENLRKARKKAIDAHTLAWTRNEYYYLGDKDLSESFSHIVERDTEDWPSEDNMFKGQPTYETDLIDIVEGDAISATMLDLGFDRTKAYPELLALTADRPNLIYCGVHANMCLLARPNGMRTMAKAGKSLWFVRDLTDASVGNMTEGYKHEAQGMYDEAQKINSQLPVVPYNPSVHYNHFDAVDLVVDWIGANLGALTETSTYATGQPRFRFPADDINRQWPRVS
jgi:hypothetical protein